MGTIIGEGITFDDVLLVPQYSEVTPNMIDLTTNDQKNQVKHSYDECSNGYGYRIQDGDCHGSSGWYRYHSQEHVNRSTG